METQNETQFLNGLGELKQSLDANTLQLRVIQRQIEQLSKFSQEENYEYLQDLMHPETRPGAKIPSRIPVPSTTFQLKSVATASTNGKGNLLVKANPWVLASDAAVGKTFSYKTVTNYDCWGYICPPFTGLGLDSYASLDGINETVWNNTFFQGIDMGQTIPDGLYSSFRVVSASLRAKYIGPVEKASGLCGGGITNHPIEGSMFRYYNVVKDSTKPPYDPSHNNYNTLTGGTEFTVFNNIDHLTYSYSGNVLDGVRLLYFPIDNKYEEFTKVFRGDENDLQFLPYPPDFTLYSSPLVNVKTFNNSFWWLIYFQGLPASTQCVRLELTINYELMPSEKYLNYMPISINPVYIDSKMRRKLLMQVASKAVTKNKDPDDDK